MREPFTAMHKKPLVDCSEVDCDKQFASEWAMQRHIKSGYLCIRFDCLLEDCARYSNPVSARSSNERTHHGVEALYAPYPDCNKQLTQKSDMPIHVDSSHLDK